MNLERKMEYSRLYIGHLSNILVNSTTNIFASANILSFFASIEEFFVLYELMDDIVSIA